MRLDSKISDNFYSRNVGIVIEKEEEEEKIEIYLKELIVDNSKPMFYLHKSNILAN